MRIIINGASGFLGRTFLKVLSDRTDVEVQAFTSKPEELKAQFSDFTGLTTEDRASGALWKDADIFINFAFPRTLTSVEIAPGLDYITDQLKKAADSGAKALINISSQSVYDPKRNYRADETSVIDLADTYAVGKYASELLTNSICGGIPHTNLRMASLIGPNFNQRLVNKFAMKVKGRENLHLKAGKQKYGFMDVRDAAEGIASMLDSDPATWEEVYVLGNHNEYSLTELAQAAVRIGAERGYKSRIISVPSDDYMNSTLDPSKFEKTFGWQAKRDIDDTLRDIFKSL